MGPTEPEPELNQDKLDEQACGERVNYWLKKYACTLHGVAILENGSVKVQVAIVKIPLEIRKQIKEAEKRGKTIQVADGDAAEGGSPNQAG